MTTQHTWPVVEDEVLQHLPPVLRAIVKALGFGRAGVFLKEHGGMPWVLPKRKTVKHGLMPDELERLRETLKPHADAEGRLTLPKADKLFAHVRNQDILRQRDVESISKQARTYHLTTRQVLNIRGEFDKTNRLRPSKLRRNLVLDATELNALLAITLKAASDTSASPIYVQLLHKLDRAAVRQEGEKASQFSLF